MNIFKIISGVFIYLLGLLFLLTAIVGITTDKSKDVWIPFFIFILLSGLSFYFGAKLTNTKSIFSLLKTKTEISKIPDLKIKPVEKKQPVLKQSGHTHVLNVDLQSLYDLAKKSKQKNIKKYTPQTTEKCVLSYFENINELNSLYMPSRLKGLIDIIEKQYQYLYDVSEQPKFNEYLNEGLITFKLTNKETTLSNNQLDLFKKLNRSHLEKYINNCILKQAQTIVDKNYQLIANYKRKDHIKGRYETIVESLDTLTKSVITADNYDEVNEFLSLHKERAYTRGELYLST